MTPSNVGVDPKKILNIINTLDECNCHSLMILKNEKVICEGWWKPYHPSYNHVMFSLSKSFVAVAICFAVQEGLLSFDDFLIDFFTRKKPEKLKEYFPFKPCENMEKVQIKHLLMMGLGHETSSDPDWFLSDDWLKEILYRYIEKAPGSYFSYDNGCPFLCSVIIQNLTGQTVFEYLKPRLFDPLGIKDAWWETNKDGYNIGRGGLNLKTEDIAKFGIFLIRKGNWQGKQLLQSQYIDIITTCKISTAESLFTKRPVKDWKQGYGYYFWMCQPEGVYRAEGACCQFCVVMPKNDIVVAITAGTSTAGQIILQSLWDNLDDLTKDSSPIANNEIDQKQLNERLNSLIISPFIITDSNFIPQYKIPFPNKTFSVFENHAKISKIAFSFGETYDTIQIWVKNQNNSETNDELFEVKAGHGQWIENNTNFRPDDFHANYTLFYNNTASASYWNDNEYHIRFIFTRTPYIDTFKVQFDGNTFIGEYQCRPIMPLRGNKFMLFGRVVE